MSSPVALISAAGGIGDILRITPLIRVFVCLGYEVDVLLAPDYLDTVKLLEGAQEIRNLFYTSSPWCSQKQQRLEGLAHQVYDVATFTLWSAALQNRVLARQVFVFEQREWVREGDSRCIEKIARSVGWDSRMPAPFAIASERIFDLSPSTVALHPGCKPGWPWKKWHGFEELARRIPEVAIIGTTSDLNNQDTYFGKSFAWPPHVKNFVGALSLPDAAALIGQCAALVSNDSGMMHVAVALGVPTFGIFGLTSPARECIPAPNMIAITKGSSCETACRTQPWGRRDCQYHLECLKTLTAEEVFGKLAERLPEPQMCSIFSQ
jgi:hypothetical protein